MRGIIRQTSRCRWGQLLGSARLRQLDILRAVAVLMVIAHHCFYVITPSYPRIVRAWASASIRAGWSGVDLFFVLSGFLVSGLLFREYQKHGRISIGRFLIRRGLKIYPSFYFFLLVTAVIQLLTKDAPPIDADYARRLGAELLFVQNYLPGLWGHTWSLAVEEHFYLSLALGFGILVARARKMQDPFKSLPWIFVVLAATVLILRILTVYMHPVVDDRQHYFPTHLRIDSLAFGVLLSYFYNCHRQGFVGIVRGRRKKILIVSLILASAALIFRRPTHVMVTIGYSLLYLGFGGLLSVSMCSDDWAGVWNSRLGKLLAYIGSHSYSIYLWHLLIAVHTEDVLTALLGSRVSYYGYVATYPLGSIVVGIAMAKLVEYPVMRLRDRFFPARSEAVT